MRKERNLKRRDEPKETDEPAEKRRKTGEEEWKRVRKQIDPGEKRKGEEGCSEIEKENEPANKKRRIDDIRTHFYREKRAESEPSKDGNLEAQLPGEQEKKRENNPKPKPRYNAQEGATYGSWQNGEFMDEDFWDKYLEERRKRIEKEEKNRNDRIDRARRGAQSWELARNCRDIIEEIKTNSWQGDEKGKRKA